MISQLQKPPKNQKCPPGHRNPVFPNPQMTYVIPNCTLKSTTQKRPNIKLDQPTKKTYAKHRFVTVWGPFSQPTRNKIQKRPIEHKQYPPTPSRRNPLEKAIRISDITRISPRLQNITHSRARNSRTGSARKIQKGQYHTPEPP